MTIQRPAVQCALQFSLLTFVTLDRVNNKASDIANASGNHYRCLLTQEKECISTGDMASFL